MIKILNYIVGSVRLIIVITIMAFYYLWFKLLRPFKKDKLAWGLRVQQLYTYPCLFFFGTKYSMEGQLYDQPALYVSNHRSLLDPVIIRHYVTAMSVAKAEISKYPVLGKSVAQTGIVFVNRSDKNSRSNAKDAIVETLKAGRPVLLFPEGTVSDLPTTLEFRRGSFEKAHEAGVPVIPITLIYNHPRYYWYNMPTMTYYFQAFGLRTPKVHMIVGEPIMASTAEESMLRARSVINSNLERVSYEDVRKS